MKTYRITYGFKQNPMVIFIQAETFEEARRKAKDGWKSEIVGRGTVRPEGQPWIDDWGLIFTDNKPDAIAVEELPDA